MHKCVNASVGVNTCVCVRKNKTTDYKSHNPKLTDQNRNTRRYNLWGSPARTIWKSRMRFRSMESQKAESYAAL